MNPRLRRRARRVRLTPRDMIAISLVARGQPVVRAQVQQLLGLSAAASYRLMRRLFDGGYVRSHVFAQEGPNLYTLTTKGAAELSRLGHEDARVLRKLGRHQHEHHLGAVDAFVALQVAASKAPHLELDKFLFERDVRKAVGRVPSGALIPDSVACLVSRNWELALAIEVDTGSERPQVIVNKALAYSQATELRGRPFRVALLTTGPHALRRAHRLARAIWNEPAVPEGLCFFTTSERLSPASVLTDEAWMTVQATSNTARLVPRCPIRPPETTPSDGLRGRAAPNRLQSQGFEATCAGSNHGLVDGTATGTRAAAVGGES